MVRAMATLAVVLLGCSGSGVQQRPTQVCAAPPPKAIAAQPAALPAPSPYRSGLWLIRKQYVENIVSPACNGVTSAPATQEVTEGDLWPSHPLRAGHVYQQPCGMIANEMNTPEYQTRFVQTLCVERSDGVDLGEACAQKFRQTFMARLVERYWAANLERVNNRCQAHPIECSDLETLERWAIESQNDAVSERARVETQATFEQGPLGDPLSAHTRARELELNLEQARVRRERDPSALAAIEEAMRAVPAVAAPADSSAPADIR
jgi:hypothetical protein